MKIVSISSKNQITVPVSVLESLNLSGEQKLLIEAKNNLMILKPIPASIVESHAGSLTAKISAKKKNVPFSQVINQTRKIAAKKIAG